MLEEVIVGTAFEGGGGGVFQWNGVEVVFCLAGKEGGRGGRMV